MAIKKIIPLTLVCSMLLGNVTTFAFNFNNNTEKSDFKLDEGFIDDFLSRNPSSENSYKDIGRDINVDSTIVSYLIENNIITREESITYRNNAFEVEKEDIHLNDKIDKSDFLMGVYKSIYGVIESRGIQKGDDIYFSPNVIELYLKELSNKSIIGKESLLINLDENSQYSNEIDIVNLDDFDNSLGKSFELSGNSIDRVDIDYFVNENISTYEALKLVESILRLTEKDLTDTEINIITYKYGSSFILDLPSETRRTVAYLISMGVIDFENPEEFGNIYDNLDINYAYTLMYRLHNKAGRKDFSTIQLNDTDDILMKEGFVEQNLEPVVGYSGALPQTLGVSKKVDEVSLLERFLGSVGIEYERKSSSEIYADDSLSFDTYIVAKYFHNGENVKYKGVTIGDFIRIDDLKEDYEEITNIVKKDDGYIFEFEVYVPSEIQAVATIDSRLTLNGEKSDIAKDIPTITQISSENTKVTYIKQSDLNKASSELAVINDKTLQNKVTGDLATLLTEENLALVGNRIIESDSEMILLINGEIYYNMDVICALMTNAFINTIDPSKIYLDIELPEEEILDVVGSSLNLEKVPVSKFTFERNETVESDIYMYNSVLLTKGVSTLIKEIDVSIDKFNTYTLVVDWSYVKPNSAILEEAENIDNPTIKDISNVLHTRPSDDEIMLQEWWDNNYYLSNAIANMMYNTTDKNIEYITSGYMVPSVYILTDESIASTEEIIRRVFSDFRINTEYVDKFCKGNLNNFYEILFNGDVEESLESYRSFQVIRSHKNADGYLAYGEQFVTLDTGALYRSFESDNRLSLVQDDSGEKAVEIHTREVEEISEINKGAVVNFYHNGRVWEYIVDSIVEDDNKSPYYKLVAINYIEGVPSIQDDVYNALLGVSEEDDGTKILGDDIQKKLYDSIVEPLPNGTFLPWDKIEPVMRNAEPSIIEEGIYYIIENEVKVGKKQENGDIKLADVTGLEQVFDVRSYTTLYLKANEWRLEDNILTMGKTNNYFNNGNILYSGINNSLTSRLLDMETTTIPYNDISNGSTILIGDMEFIKKEDGIISYPLNNKNIASSIKNAIFASVEIDDNVTTEILKVFSGITINQSDRVIPFTSYIKDAFIGGINSNSEINLTLAANEKGLCVYTAPNTYVSVADETPESVVIGLDLDKDTYFRKIDFERNVYELVPYTNSFSSGYIDDANIFYEEMDLKETDDIFLDFSKEIFNVIENATELKDEIIADYKYTLNRDRLLTINAIAVCLLSYATVVSWVVYCFLSFTELRIWVESFTELTEDTGYRIDIIKIISIGVFNVKSRLGLIQMIIGNIGCLLLVYYIITYLKV